MRDEEAETRLFRHVDEALKNATEAGQIADVARLEALKGRHQDDEALLKSALVRAESSGDTSAEAFSAAYYGHYLGQRGQFVASLGHIERAIEILGAQGNQLSQARTMARIGRCYSSRAGKLDQALVFAGRVSDIADALDSAELRAWRAMEAEPYFYKGLWDEAVLAAEEALPVAWEIGEWTVVFFSSAWLALAYLKLGQPDKARRVLDRVFKEAPARLYKTVSVRNPLRADRPSRGPSDHRSPQRGPEYPSPGASRLGTGRLPSRRSCSPSSPRASPRGDGRSG